MIASSTFTIIREGFAIWKREREIENYTWDVARIPRWMEEDLGLKYLMQKEVYEFISKQTKDPIVEWKTCTIRGEDFAIFQSDLDFYKKVSPIYN